MAARRVEKKIAYRKADAHASAWEHLQLLDDSITEALLNIRENMADRKPKLHEVAKAVQISVQLKTSLQKWAEDEGQNQDAEEFFAGWSEDQITAFIESGTLPTHAVIQDSQIIDVEQEKDDQLQLPEPQQTTDDPPDDSPDDDEDTEDPGDADELVDAVDYDPDDVDNATPAITKGKHRVHTNTNATAPSQQTGHSRTADSQKPHRDHRAQGQSSTETAGAGRQGASLEPGQHTPRTTAEGGGEAEPDARRRPRLRRKGAASGRRAPEASVSKGRAPLSPPVRGADEPPAWLEDED
jgi:hypothetical protein